MKKLAFFIMLTTLFAACSKYPMIHTYNNTDMDFVLVGLDGSISGIRDNADEKKHPATLFDAPDSLMQTLGLQDGVESSIRTYIVREQPPKSACCCVLIDAGLGEMVGGQLQNRLKDLKIDTVNHILLTHMHGDHIGGLLSDGQPVFKHAQLWLSAKEYAFWMEGENPLQQAVMAAYADRLHLFCAGDSLPLGIEAIDAPGHTPGHVAFRYGSVMIIGDAIHGWDLQKDHPEYCARFDMDKEQAISTRKALLEKCREEHLLIAGMHLPSAFEK